MFTALERCQAAPGWRDLVLALILAAPVPLVMALMPYVLVNYTQHDIFIPLDAAWRTLSAQWPHTDYYTPLGLSYVGMHGAAAWLFGMDGRVVDRANLVALPFVLIPAMLLAWRRLGVLATVVLVVLLSVLVTSPVFVDGPERLIAHLANYNRVGGGLCAVVALWALCPPDRRSGRLDAAEVVALALVFLILLTLKVTFFALAAVVVLVGCCTRGLPWSRAVAVAVLTLVGVAGLELLHPGLLLAYGADIRRAGTANTQMFRGFYTPQALLANLPLCFLIGALAATGAWMAPERWLGPERRAIAGILVVMAACVLVATQNFGAFSAPLVVLVILLARRLTAPALAAFGLAAILLAVTPFLITQVVGTAYMLTQRPGKGVVVGGGRSDTLGRIVWLPNPVERAFVPATFTVEEAERWQAVLPVDVAAAVLNDGLDLLTRDGLTGRRIENLAFSNPFPVAFRAPPPRGVALWWDENRTFTVDRLTPAAALGDAEVVMVPRLWWQEQITIALLSVVQPALTRDYTPHESHYWTAWVRKPGP